MLYTNIFGPINSRRLGSSLGINLTPHKICSFDCIYCEAGATTELTTIRKEYINTNEIIKEIENKLKTKPNIDYITFSGKGEPTLHSGIGEIINYIKTDWKSYKLCLITNSSMLYNESIYNDLSKCDLIMPSLDAATQNIFEIINKPEKTIHIDNIINSLINFRTVFKNQLFLEIFIIENINDTLEELALLKTICKKIKPDKICLNTLDRNPVKSWVKKASDIKLLEIKNFFASNGCICEIV